MKYILLLFFCFFFSKARCIDSCDCSKNFKFLKSGVEKNYVGYEYRVRKLGKFFLDSVNYRFTKLVDTIHGVYPCYILLYQYLDHFKDPHLTISFKSIVENRLKISKIFYDFPKIGTDLSLSKPKKNTKIHTFEGEYESVFYNQRIRVVKSKIGFTAYILRGDNVFWFPGQIKFVIEKKDLAENKMWFYGKEHILVSKKFSFDGSKIELVPGDVFIKGIPLGLVKEYSNPSFHSLSSRTNLLKLNDFGAYNKSSIDSVVNSNWQEINRKPNLLIDLRNNSGGTTSCFDTLIGLLYTGAYTSDKYSKLYSQENFDLEFKVLQNILSKSDLKSYKDSLYSQIGKFVDISPDTIVRNNISPYPKKIAILIDGGVMSAAEIFVNYARNSKKVILMGMNTRGAYDNVDLIPRDMPCALFRYNCPISRVERSTLIDGIGFYPNIKLDFSNYSQWVSEAQKYLEKNEDK